MIAVTPASAAAVTQSSKGKKASDAMTAPFISERHLLIPFSTAQIRLVCPGPMAMVMPSFTKTMPLDLVCFTTFMAISKSRSWPFLRLLVRNHHKLTVVDQLSKGGLRLLSGRIVRCRLIRLRCVFRIKELAVRILQEKTTCHPLHIQVAHG